MDDSARLAKNARMFLEITLKAKPGESLVIVTRDKFARYARAVAQGAAELGVHPVILDLTEHLAGAHQQGVVLAPVKAAIAATDMAVSIAACALFGDLIGEPETNDVFLMGENRRLYLKCAVPPMETWELEPEDLSAIWNRTYALIDRLHAAKVVRVTTDLGTDFTFGLGPEANCTPILGIAPIYAEVAIAPAQGSESGVFVIDGPTQMGVRPTDEVDRPHLRIVVKDGRVADATGDPQQLERLHAFIASGDPPADRIDEVGIVTTHIKAQDAAWRDGCHSTETVHIALGNNLKRDRYVHGARHMDGLLTRPTVALDGEVIMREGKLLLR